MASAPILRHLGPGEFLGESVHSARIAGLRFTDLRHESRRALPAHEHELAYFSLLLEGGYSETIGPRTLRYRPGGVGFHPEGMSHRDEVGAGRTRFFCIELESPWLTSLREAEGRIEASPAVYEGELAWLAFRLHRELQAPDGSTALGLESIACEMLAELALEGSRFDARPPGWLPRVKELIRERKGPRAGLGVLAKEAGVHPVYLARAFRRFERCSIGEYSRRARVVEACRELLRAERSLAEIAVDAGFADQAHFTRVFKRLTGQSPGAFRSSVALKA